MILQWAFDGTRLRPANDQPVAREQVWYYLHPSLEPASLVKLNTGGSRPLM